MGLFVFCIVALVIIVFLANAISTSQEESMKKAMAPYEERKQKYLEALQNYCKANSVQMCPEQRRKKYNYVGVKFNDSYHLRWVWYDNEKLIFCTADEDLVADITMENNVCIVPKQDIEFYSKDGNISYTNQVINKGKNISVSGAVVGGLIAGEAGAIIGAGKDANKLENKTVSHDNVKTVIYYKVGTEVKTLSINGQAFYSYINQAIPDKEYSYIQNKAMTLQNNTETSDVRERLEKIDELHKMGLITDDEYNAKRENILNSI